MNPNGLTDEQVKQGYSTLPGNFDPVTGQLKTAITSASLAPQPSPDLSQSFTPQPDLVTPTVAGAGANQATFDTDYQRYLDLQNQGQDNSLANMIAGVAGDIEGLGGRGAAQQQSDNKYGVNQFTQRDADLSAQRKSMMAEFNQSITQQRAEQANLEAGAGAKGLTTAMLGGQQAALARVREAENQTAAAKIGLLDAEILGNQGKLEAAQNAANRAVDLMYQDREATVNTKLKQIELYTPLFNANEKKKADALTFALNKENDRLAEEKANKKALENLFINAANQGAPQSLIDEAKKSGSVVDAAVKLGRYSGEYLDRQIKLAQLEKLGVETDKLRGKETGGIRGLSLEELSKFNSTPQVKAVRSASIYAQAAADYKAAINTYGTGEWFGKGSGTLNQAYSALVGATKDYYTLGTYDNGVQKLIALGIPEPSVLGLKANRIGGLDTALKSAKDQIKKDINSLINTEYNGARELQTIIDDAAALEYSTMSPDEFLSQIPSSGASVGTNQAFFNAGTTSTPIR